VVWLAQYVSYQYMYVAICESTDVTLKEYKSFVEWNKDPEISQAASDLYGGNIDRLELYPGLHAEGGFGDGLQDYSSEPLRISTMRNGLLIDAITLVRISLPDYSICHYSFY
jgi:hypothetical protein